MGRACVNLPNVVAQISLLISKLPEVVTSSVRRLVRSIVSVAPYSSGCGPVDRSLEDASEVVNSLSLIIHLVGYLGLLVFRQNANFGVKN